MAEGERLDEEDAMNGADTNPQPPCGDERLTEREIQILRLVHEGIARKVIADQLRISIATLQTHLKHIRAKLGVSSAIAALAKARKLSLLKEEPGRYEFHRLLVAQRNETELLLSFA